MFQTASPADSSKMLGILMAIAVISCPARARADDFPPSNAQPLGDFSLLPNFTPTANPPSMLSDPPQNPHPDHAADRWRFRSELFLWGLVVDGRVGLHTNQQDLTSETSGDFSDLTDKFNYGIDVNFEAGKGPISGFIEGMYARWWRDDQSLQHMQDEANLRFHWVFTNFGLAYRFLDTPLGQTKSSNLALDALVGSWWTYMRLEIAPHSTDCIEQDKDWFDPYVGLRARWDITQHWSIFAQGTVGGFNVGSDFAWSAMGFVEYRFTRSIGAFIGYRAISYDFERDDDFLFDATIHGPLIGLSYNF